MEYEYIVTLKSFNSESIPNMLEVWIQEGIHTMCLHRLSVHYLDTPFELLKGFYMTYETYDEAKSKFDELYDQIAEFITFNESDPQPIQLKGDHS